MSRYLQGPVSFVMFYLFKYFWQQVTFIFHFQCNIIRGGQTLVVLVKFPLEIALLPPPLLEILFSREMILSVQAVMAACWKVILKFENLAWLRSYFAQVGPRQINWVSCHENTLNNVINHELLIRQTNKPTERGRQDRTDFLFTRIFLDIYMYPVCQCLLVIHF